MKGAAIISWNTRITGGYADATFLVNNLVRSPFSLVGFRCILPVYAYRNLQQVVTALTIAIDFSREEGTIIRELQSCNFFFWYH